MAVCLLQTWEVREMKTNVILLLFGLTTMMGLMTGCQSTAPISLNSFKPAEATFSSSPNSSASLVTLGQTEQFDKIVQQAPGVVLVDFYADWCKPCQTQGKILKGLKTTASANQAQIVKVNVDQHPALAQKFQANALPTLLVLKRGKVVERRQGLTSAAEITSLLKR